MPQLGAPGNCPDAMHPDYTLIFSLILAEKALEGVKFGA